MRGKQLDSKPIIPAVISVALSQQCGMSLRPLNWLFVVASYRGCTCAAAALRCAVLVSLRFRSHALRRGGAADA